MPSPVRVQYVTIRKLKTITKMNDKGICYLPICLKCKKWLLNTIAIYKSYGSKRFICLKCAMSVWGREYIYAKLKKHVQILSKNEYKSNCLYRKYKQILTKL
jgi:hypothetical protein